VTISIQLRIAGILGLHLLPSSFAEDNSPLTLNLATGQIVQIELQDARGTLRPLAMQGSVVKSAVLQLNSRTPQAGFVATTATLVSDVSKEANLLMGESIRSRTDKLLPLDIGLAVTNIVIGGNAAEMDLGLPMVTKSMAMRQYDTSAGGLMNAGAIVFAGVGKD
jgi:hypothetical protein